MKTFLSRLPARRTSLRSLLLGTALLLSAASASAQDALPVQESIFTAGVTAEGGGQTWAYLIWQSNAPELLPGTSYSIWVKEGAANALGPYTRAAAVNLQVDPLAISALVDRAVHALGEDPVALENTITNLFEDLATGSIGLPEKISGVILGALTEDRHVENLLLAARRHPALNMALGQAVALPIPPAGDMTFEIREHDSARNADLGVVGRVTVNHAAPVLLPPPTAVAAAPMNPQTGFSNLNIKLRWDTPDALRRVQLLTQGFNLYRVDKTFAEGDGWPGSPPSGEIISALSEMPGSGVDRVNQAPITPDQMLTAPEVTTADHEVFFYIDEETRFPGFPDTHTAPKHGDQFYYFVTVRDILGRDIHSGTSPGTLGTFCDTMPPRTPRGLKVTNEFTYNGGAEEQVLRLHWDAPDNSGDKKTTGYLIYRWSRSDEVYQLGGDPSVNLVTPIPLPYTQTSWEDPGPYDMSTGLIFDNTVWYTIRAVDDGMLSPPGAAVCADPPFYNLSGHSAPAPGVLRDRVGPARPDGTIQTWCVVPKIEGKSPARRPIERPDPDYLTFYLTAERPENEPNIVAVDFRRVEAGGIFHDLGRVTFADNARKLTLPYREVRMNQDQKLWNFQARAVTIHGEVSGWSTIDVPLVPTADTATEVPWAVWGEYQRVDQIEVPGQGSRYCQTHLIPPPEFIPPDEHPGITVEFLPPEGTVQYKLYARIDDGPLTLVHEDSGEFNPLIPVFVAVELLPATESELCFFLQVFDLNGNPSRMTRLGCLPVQGTQPIPKPMLAPIESKVDGIVPNAGIRWFCPPHGVERFRLWIAATPSVISAASSDLLYDDPDTPSPNIVSEDVGNGVMENFDYASFNTELVGPLFGDGAMFSLDVPVLPGTRLRVKVAAVTASGEVGPWSNVEEFEWKPEEEGSGPDVPWPARPLPGVDTADSFSPHLGAVYIDERSMVGVRIGQVDGYFRPVSEKEGYPTFVIQMPHDVDVWLFKANFAAPAGERTILPAALYRTQVPDGTLYSQVPGDIVQVSPLMETIVAEETVEGQYIQDPFIHVGHSYINQSKADIYLLDTQPQVIGATYYYLLVLFDPISKEIFKIIPAGTVTIP